jgi:hypothetical protein
MPGHPPGGEELRDNAFSDFFFFQKKKKGFPLPQFLSQS